MYHRKIAQDIAIRCSYKPNGSIQWTVKHRTPVACLLRSPATVAPYFPSIEYQVRQNSRLGVSARVTVLTASFLDEIVHGNTLLDVANNPSRFLVAVLATTADCRKLEPLLKEDWAPGNFALGNRVAYLWCPDGVLKSPLSAAIGRVAGDSVTTRTWGTIMKIHAAIHHQNGSQKGR